jgi:hypothetical protein
MTYPPNGWHEYVSRRDQIAELLDPRCYTIKWLDLQIIDAKAHVFANPEAVIIVEVRVYPAGAREIHGLCAAGDLPAILDLIEQAESWGRSEGLDFASVASREGWQRVLESKGYRPHQLEVRKELRDGPIVQHD